MNSILLHTKDTKVVIFDISCEYPLLLCDIFSDKKIESKVIIDDRPADASAFARSIVKPRDLEDDPRVEKALSKIYDMGRVSHLTERDKAPVFSEILYDIQVMREDSSNRPTYVNALDQIEQGVRVWMSNHHVTATTPIDADFVDFLDGIGKEAVKRFNVFSSSQVASWATTRDYLKTVLERASQGSDEEDSGTSQEDLHRILQKDLRLLCISVADPARIRSLVTKLTNASLAYRKRSFEIKPQILFVFDEAQEFVPSTAPGNIGDCARSVETLMRQGRKYGLGRAIATQRVAYLNTNVMQQLHTFFVGTLPRPYDRTVVSSSFRLT